MKRLMILALVLISGASLGQTVKNVGDFDEVKVYDRITVYLVKSDENKVEVSGRRSNEVELVNKNGELKIRMKLGKLLQGDNIEARVHYKYLESIDASEGSVVSSEGPIVQDEFEITAKEGAEITLNLEVRDLEVRAVTGGMLNLSGRANEMEAKLGTGGELRAKDLMTSKTEISIRAGGQAQVHATDRVETDIKAGGDIVVYGNPSSVNEKSSLGGSVTFKK